MRDLAHAHQSSLPQAHRLMAQKGSIDDYANNGSIDGAAQLVDVAD